MKKHFTGQTSLVGEKSWIQWNQRGCFSVALRVGVLESITTKSQWAQSDQIVQEGKA